MTGGLDQLTPRELQVIELVADQRTNEEIAELLLVSPWTVKRHVAAILAKLGVANRLEAGRVYRSEMARRG
jgi:DNA-binding NarL/FixJ family response regulator